MSDLSQSAERMVREAVERMDAAMPLHASDKRARILIAIRQAIDGASQHFNGVPAFGLGAGEPEQAFLDTVKDWLASRERMAGAAANGALIAAVRHVEEEYSDGETFGKAWPGHDSS